MGLLFLLVGMGGRENEKTRLLLYMVMVGAVQNLVCLPVASVVSFDSYERLEADLKQAI